MKTLLKKASEAYYNGEPFLTNEQYDALEAKYSQVLEGEGEIAHMHRMYSLQKTYDMSDTPFPVGDDVIESPKLDGAAVSLLYIDGKLAMALTRGDGIKGRDITDKMRYVAPDNIEFKQPFQVTGEVVCPKDVPNARNFASGALNLKNMDEFLDRANDLYFVAYGVSEEFQTDSYFQDMVLLTAQGFYVCTDIPKEQGACVFPLDGVVYRIDSNDRYNDVGYTSKFPRGAFAYKQNAEGVVTTLLDVIWQTGKTGKVSPVAILEPIKIGDATVSRATLNNIAFIEAMDLVIGCKVKVVRSGEIIPCITERVE